MSRALEGDEREALGKAKAQAFYNDIVQALNCSLNKRLEIEFLPKGYILPPNCNVLVDENYIGVPKSKLVQAFVVARKLLVAYLEDLSNVPDHELRNTTAVLLLMDAENLTAANTRKRLILRHKDSSDIHSILRQELLLVEGLLTSRLHRHTKSPTLWNHRRWVMELGKTVDLPYDFHQDLTEVIMVSAERHPRNYYAWQHARWIVYNILGKDGTSISQLDDKLIAMVLSWCTKHPSDTSGFSFLLFCSFELPESIVPRSETCSKVHQEIFHLATSFKWANESVWVFLRTLVASGQLSAEQEIAFHHTIDAMTATTEDLRVKATLMKAGSWSKINCHQHLDTF
ncbi:hypothetical protein BJ878DRAFT_87440 [Calycina marina]|uniref:Protein prenyltransferase alpha subunit repeat-containing protein 1 n=1 Tax=Calycina marina TaxID=1763456 RepID=A0A9P8CEU5_9HELO|nr:hypothetical protein BJ878DRAFT_87440 [Calycina marina]